MTLVEILASTSPAPGTERQISLLQKLAAVLQADSACLGAAVAGSFAKGTADHLSDIDLVVFCSTGSSLRLLSDIRSVAETRDVLKKFEGWHDEHSPYEKTILVDLSSFEFHMIEPLTRFTLKAPYIELVNRLKTLEARFSAAAAPERDEQKPYLNGDEGLAWELFNCFKWACREQTSEAKQYIRRLALAINQQA